MVAFFKKLENAKVFDLGLGQFYQNKLEPFSEDHPGIVVQNIFRTPLWKLRAWTRLENWLRSWAVSWEKLCSSRELRYFSSCLCAYDRKKVPVSKHAGSIKNKTKQNKKSLKTVGWQLLNPHVQPFEAQHQIPFSIRTVMRDICK